MRTATCSWVSTPSCTPGELPNDGPLTVGPMVVASGVHHLEFRVVRASLKWAVSLNLLPNWDLAKTGLCAEFGKIELAAAQGVEKCGILINAL